MCLTMVRTCGSILGSRNQTHHTNMKIAHIVKISTPYTSTKPNGETFQAANVTWSDGRNTVEDINNIRIQNGTWVILSAF